MALRLYHHNQKAYEAALAMMNDFGKAAVIHPTGTGKSLLAFKLAEDHPEANICWLSPSRYIYDGQRKNRKREDPASSFDNITFLTYARLAANRDRVEHLHPDFIILDEFHRCGAIQWSKGVKELLTKWPQAKVLGLSATPIRYLDEQRNMADELFDGHIASTFTLGEAITAGILPSPRYVISIYRYEKEIETYAKRIGLLRDSKRRKEAGRKLEKLRRALEQADGLDVIFKRYLKKNGKYLVFCSGQTHLKEMERQAGEWFGAVDPAYHLYSVYAEKQESTEEFDRFEKDRGEHLKLLFCINMLNEGIHVPDIDGVILMRPTVSPVIYKQQIGRALTVGQQKNRGEQDNREGQKTRKAQEDESRRQDGESRPLILDIVNNFQNLQSFRAMEEEFEQASIWMQLQNPEREAVAETGYRFQVIDETHQAGQIFRDLQEQLETGWDEYYEEAVRYREEYGNLEVPARYVTPSGLPLGNWLVTQRRVYTGKISGQMKEEQIRKLNELGIRWESYSDRQWEQYFSQAAEYYARNGNLDVKADYVTEKGFRLGMWLNHIRQYRLNGSRVLNGQRQKQLEQIGMIWDKFTYKWERGYAAAREYYEAHGDLEVPAGFVTEKGLALGNWLAAQRQNQRGANPGALPLTEDQVSRLNEIGMNWTGRRAGQWEQCYAAAVCYRQEHGTLEMPADFQTPEGICLSAWIRRQRNFLKTKKATGDLTGEEREHIRRLTEIGLDREPDSWKEKWELARRYYETNGNLDIPQSFVTEEGVWLGKWVYRQRLLYRKTVRQAEEPAERKSVGKKEALLTKEQTAQLESIGIECMTPAMRAWEAAFEKAKSYYDKNHHLRVEKGYVSEDGFRLDLWVKRQRKYYKEGNRKALPEENAVRLSEIGMEW